MKSLKIIVLAVLLAVITTLIIQPTYAAIYDTRASKVDSAKLSGVYYYKLSIQGSKLIAIGTYARCVNPTKYSVQLQITKPVTYASTNIGTDGIAYLGANSPIKIGQRWELKTTIPVVRSASCAGAKNISLEIDLSGLSDGIYCLQEIVSQGSKKEGNYCDSTLLVIYNGHISLQTTWQWSDLSSWWHDAGFWID